MMSVAMGRIDTQGAGWTDARFPRNDLDVVQLCHDGTKIDKPRLAVKVFLRNLPVKIVVADEAGAWNDGTPVVRTGHVLDPSSSGFRSLQALLNARSFALYAVVRFPIIRRFFEKQLSAVSSQPSA